jgi:hypothetical protein
MFSPVRNFVVALCVIASASVARGNLISLVASHDPTQPNAFTLDFGQFGGETGAQISNTDFVLDVDATRGTASFVSYVQSIQSITLPGGVPTGAIGVTIVPGSSSGTYNPLTGDFSTSEDYKITFANDLSMFGLESPVTLPSSSTGNIDFGKSRISQNWAGIGQIGTPPNTFPFAYTCAVNTVFTPEPTALALMGLGTMGLLIRRKR